MSERRSGGRHARAEAAQGRRVVEKAASGPDVGRPAAGDRLAIGPSTDQLRIAAIQAVVAAGLAPSTGRQRDAEEAPSALAAPPLPDWTDPPTGQVPRVLLAPGGARGGAGPGGRHLRGPTWRQDAADWEHDSDLGMAFLVEDDAGVAASLIAGANGAAKSEARDDDPLAWPPPPRREGAEAKVPDAGAPAPGGAPRSAGRGRNLGVATATGAGVGGLAVACFLLGPLPTLALVAVVLCLAAGEAFATLRRAGRRPVSLAGLVAVGMLPVGAYLWGPVAVSWVLVGLLLAGVLWCLGRGARAAPVQDLGATMLVTCWVGVPAAFAGLLLAPASFPHRHGVAFCFAVVAVTVAHDVGSYAAGSRLGRHRLAPRVSPGKTWEGLAGGTALAFLVALGGVSRIAPISLAAAAVLAAIVAVLAPLGDLAESLVKRDLGVKDMGRLLPAHGGMFDRVDAMLLVLPAAYALFRLAHLG